MTMLETMAGTQQQQQTRTQQQKQNSISTSVRRRRRWVGVEKKKKKSLSSSKSSKLLTMRMMMMIPMLVMVLDYSSSSSSRSSTSLLFCDALKNPSSATTTRRSKTTTASLSLTTTTTSTNIIIKNIPKGGGGGGGVRNNNKNKKTGQKQQSSSSLPSFYWAVFHNWMYFLSLGFNAINIQFLIRSIIDGSSTTSSSSASPSPLSIRLSGQVESVDKLLTFVGVGFLAALSDKIGRKPLMIWSAVGFAITNLIQSSTPSQNIWALYIADFIDGCTSCMMPVCQAYIVDCSSGGGTQQCATNLGIFQGLSAGGAFIFAFPLGGLIGYKKGPRVALRIAAIIQVINAIVLLLFTPESNPSPKTTTTHDEGTPTKNNSKSSNKKKNIMRMLSEVDLQQANPIGCLNRLFGRKTLPLIRIGATAYFLANLARGSLDAQFPNYTNIRFGWTQAQSGPVLVLVGLMLAIIPRIVVPIVGLRHSIGVGLLVFSAGLIGAGLSPTPTLFVSSIAVVAIGCICLPTLQALLANLAPPKEGGALLGALGAINELTGAIASTMYAVLLAKFNPPVDGDAPFDMPGFHFLVGASLLLIAGALTVPGLKAHKDDIEAFNIDMEEVSSSTDLL